MARVKRTSKSSASTAAKPASTAATTPVTTPGWQQARADADLTLWLPGDVPVFFRLIRPGEFRMGARGNIENEEPIHLVRITRAFYLGTFPVTQGQYRALAEGWPELKLDPRPSYFTEPAADGGPTGGGPAVPEPVELRPVEQVSWDDATGWCEGLMNQVRSPRGVTHDQPAALVKWVGLPSEAEWEYACRAGSDTEFCCGDGEGALAEVGWYDRNSGSRTHAVGCKVPNRWKLYDMHGNVWEWCRDWFDHEAYRRYRRFDGEPDPEVARRNPERERVIRGGYWSSYARWARSASRPTPPEEDHRGPGVGFRIYLRSMEPGPDKSSPRRPGGRKKPI